MKNQFNKLTSNLFDAILSLKTTKEAEIFFRDLCTIDEIKEMSERWEIVRLLEKGWSYRKISEQMKISTTTVSRVAMWLNNGMGGYKLISDRINNHHNSSSSGKELR